MKQSKNKWPLAIAAALMLAVTWFDTDLEALKGLSGSDFLPVAIITAVIFLLKTGLLSVVLIGLKKLWDHFRK